MMLKNDEKFKEKLICCLKIGVRNLTNFCLKLSMVLEAHVLLCVTGPDFLRVTGPDFFKKIFLPQKWGKWAKNGPKPGVFFNLLENLVVSFV